MCSPIVARPSNCERPPQRQRAALRGGGVYLSNSAGYADVAVSLGYVTISNNEALEGGGLYDRGGTPTVPVASIIAGNRAAGSVTDAGADCWGPSSREEGIWSEVGPDARPRGTA